MKKPEVIAVNLRNGDAAVFVNGATVYSIEAIDRRTIEPAALAARLAEQLGVEPVSIEMDVPSDEDWQWEDVYELLPASKGATDSVPVAYWDSEAYGGSTPGKDKPFLFEVGDRRDSCGQMFLDMAARSGKTELLASVTMEVNRLPGTEDDVPCVHLHFDDDNLAASFFKQGDRFVIRLETDVRLASTVLDNGEHAWILE